MGKVKFPLEMKDGYKVKTLEELQEHFDIKTVMEYYFNGKLQNWLEAHYHDDILEDMENLDKEQDSLDVQIAALLGIQLQESQIDAEEIQDLVELKEEVKKYASEEELEEFDLFVDSQEDMEELIKQGKKKIYLFQNSFMIKNDYHDLELIGINNPVISIEAEDSMTFKKQNVKLHNVDFVDEKTKKKTYVNIFEDSFIQTTEILRAFYKFLDNVEGEKKNESKR